MPLKGRRAAACCVRLGCGVGGQLDALARCGTGSYTTRRRERLDRRLADETLAICLAHYRDTDDDRRAGP